jgi:hypothetical protein
MSQPSKTNYYMRIIHRYLGFFLAGIMMVYSVSGVLMIFRETDFLKSEKVNVKTLAKDIKVEDLGKEMKARDFKITKEENGVVYFKNGTFDRSTGTLQFTKKELPFVLGKMEKMHKATLKSPLYFLNMFFGFALLFFAISSFWMFLPDTDTFKKGMYYTIGGIILTLIMVFV